MTTNSAAGTPPAWLPLLQKPYENLLGSKSVWDLRMKDGTAVRIERGSQGLNNALFRVRIALDVYACKLFVLDERQRAQREWAALCALQAAGLPLAPEPLCFAPDGPLPQPIIVYRWVGGEPLGSEPISDEQLIQLTAAVRRIHYTPPVAPGEALVAWHQPSGYAGYLVEIETALARIQAWAAGLGDPRQNLPGWAADLPALLPLMETAVNSARGAVEQAEPYGGYPVAALVRVDGNLDNILRCPDGSLVFIDWEFSGWGDPAYDLAELRWHPRALRVNQARWDAAFATYAPHPDDAGFCQRLATYSRLLPAWWVTRSTLHLLEGAGQLSGPRRLAPVPSRMFRRVRTQLDQYLAALGLIEPPEEEETEE
jgi:hypothetical protein